jgi:hypothetical protein
MQVLASLEAAAGWGTHSADRIALHVLARIYTVLLVCCGFVQLLPASVA